MRILLHVFSAQTNAQPALISLLVKNVPQATTNSPNISIMVPLMQYSVTNAWHVNLHVKLASWDPRNVNPVLVVLD